MRIPTMAMTGAAVAATAGAGVLATDPDSLYYRTLHKPSWQPPPPAFGIVWTPLYTDVAVTTAIALNTLDANGDQAAKTALARALAVNLALNAGWSWLFFKSHRPWIAAAECALLTVSSADLVRRVAGADRRAGAALVPYPLWCGFATALTTAIARRNPPLTTVGGFLGRVSNLARAAAGGLYRRVS